MGYKRCLVITNARAATYSANGQWTALAFLPTALNRQDISAVLSVYCRPAVQTFPKAALGSAESSSSHQWQGLQLPQLLMQNAMQVWYLYALPAARASVYLEAFCLDGEQ